MIVVKAMPVVNTKARAITTKIVFMTLALSKPGVQDARSGGVFCDGYHGTPLFRFRITDGSPPVVPHKLVYLRVLSLVIGARGTGCLMEVRIRYPRASRSGPCFIACFLFGGGSL